VFAAVLLDQRASQDAGADLIDDWQAALNLDPTISLVREFERTAGDEMEGLVKDAASLAAIILRALQAGGWWIGIGIGDVETPLPESVRSSQGAAFVLARRAIGLAKGRPRTGRMQRVRILAERRDPGDLEAALMLMAVLFARSGGEGSEAVKFRAAGLTIVEIGQRLGVSKQAVSQQLLAAHWTEQQAGRRLVEHLAGALLR
jgi:hypothetical protein